MRTQQLHQVLNGVWAVVAEANRYFASEAPWALARTDPGRQATVLYVTAETIRQIAILAQPFMPASAAQLLDLLAVPPTERNFTTLAGAGRIAARDHVAGAQLRSSPATSTAKRARRPDADRQPGATDSGGKPSHA